MRRLAILLGVALIVVNLWPARATATSIPTIFPAGIEAFGVTIDPRDGKAYVATSDHNSFGSEYMWIADPASPPPYDPPPLPRFQLPSTQVMSVLDVELNRLFVSLSRGLGIVDVATHQLIMTVPLGGIGVGLALDAATHRVFIATSSGAAVVDGVTGTVLAQRTAPAASDAWWHIAHDPVRHRLYVANGNFGGAPSLVVLDDSGLSLIRNIPLPAAPRLALSVDAVRGLVYVGGFTTGAAAFGSLYAIDETSLEIVNVLDISAGVVTPFSMTLLPGGDTLVVSALRYFGSGGSSGQLVFVDLPSFTIRERLPLAWQPGQSALGPDGRLYVAEFDRGLVAALEFGNHAPVIRSLSFAPSVPTTSDRLTVVADAVDPDLGLGGQPTFPQIWTYEWSRNGTRLPDASGPALDLSIAGNGDRGDTISVRATASDGSLNAMRSASVVIGNARPALALSLSDAAPRTNDTLVAIASATDADGDPVRLTYAWTLNGTAISGITGPAVDLRQYGDRGDLLVATVTADDGRGGLTSASVTAAVADSAPVIALTTSTSSPLTNEWLVATAAFSDADGDAVCCGWSLRVNGVAIWTNYGLGTTQAFDLSQPGWGSRGDTITIEAVAGDGTLQTSATASLVVVNSAPQVSVALSDYSPTKKDVLVAYGYVYDADGDAGFLFTYTWRVGQKVKRVVGPTNAPTSSFDLRDLQPGDKVSVTVSTTGDSFDPSIPASATAVIVPRP